MLKFVGDPEFEKPNLHPDVRCNCFAAAVASISSCVPRFPPMPSPNSLPESGSARTIKGATELTFQARGGEQDAGRKCDSRATKTGSRRLELPMVGIGSERQQSLQTNRLGHCRAVAGPIIRSPNDNRTDAGNQYHRHPDGWNIHNGGTVG